MHFIDAQTGGIRFYKKKLLIQPEGRGMIRCSFDILQLYPYDGTLLLLFRDMNGEPFCSDFMEWVRCGPTRSQGCVPRIRTASLSFALLLIGLTGNIVWDRIRPLS